MMETDLSDAYANADHIPGAAEYPPRWAVEAGAFRRLMSASGRAVLDLPYGDHGRERFDLFLPSEAPRGLVVFVHGGYWRAFDKSSWSHLAAGAVARGQAVALPGYPLCSEVRISHITRRIAAAIGAAAARIDGGIVLAGHSAGGHLVTRMLCGDVPGAAAFAPRIRRVVSISGLHDLRPLLRTGMNADFRLDEPEAAAESAILHPAPAGVPVIAWVGADERPAFIEQTRALADAWPCATPRIEPGRHHFDVIEGLKDPASPLCNALLEG